jgi:hypothetical protein
LKREHAVLFSQRSRARSDCSESHDQAGADAEVVLVIVAAVVGGGDDALSTGSALFGSDSLSIAVG